MENTPKQSPAALMMIWGVLWLLATLGGPIAVLLLIWRHTDAALWIGGAALVLHLVASRMIVRLDAQCGQRSDSNQLSNWLIFGGWAMMLCVSFGGCALAFSRGPF